MQYCKILSMTLLLIPFSISAQTHRRFHRPELTLAKIENSAHPGKQIYKSYCSTCHAPNPFVNLGAPAKGSIQAWKPRLKRGWAHMVNNTMVGMRNMPPRGGCFECSDALIKSAIKYMLPSTLKQNYHLQ